MPELTDAPVKPTLDIPEQVPAWIVGDKPYTDKLEALKTKLYLWLKSKSDNNDVASRQIADAMTNGDSEALVELLETIIIEKRARAAAATPLAFGVAEGRPIDRPLFVVDESNA